MNAEIVIKNDRFSLFMPCDRATVSVIKKIPKRFWNNEFKTWHLPLSFYYEVKETLAQSKYEIVECNHDVIITWHRAAGRIHKMYTSFTENHRHLQASSKLRVRDAILQGTICAKRCSHCNERPSEPVCPQKSFLEFSLIIIRR
jgi:hypothetical protein